MNAPIRKSSFAIRLVQAVGIATLLASLAGFAGSLDWRIDLLNHFKFQYVLILATCLLLAMLLRAWKFAAVLACGLAINAAMLVPLFIGRNAEANTAREPIRLAAINVHTANQSFDAVIAYVDREQPDIVFFQETNQAWIDSLMAGLGEYRRLAERARDDNFGVLAMARRKSEVATLEVVAGRVITLAPDAANVPSIDVRLLWQGKPLRLLCVHTLPPVNTPSATGRDHMLEAAAQLIKNDDVDRVVILGDLNATPWCTPFCKLINDTELIDSSRGFGWQPTWPSAMIALGSIPIDHCLHSPSLVTIRREVDRSGNGSDHFPLLVELQPAKESDATN